MAEPLTPEEERELRWYHRECTDCFAVRAFATLDAARDAIPYESGEGLTKLLVEARARAARNEREAMAWRAWYSRWPESAFYADGVLWREVAAARAANEEAERATG